MHDIAGDHRDQAAPTSPKDLPANFRLIRLRLAREPRHPEGDAHHGYDILAPLEEDGRIDARACRSLPALTRVRRYRPGEEDAVGRLVHGPGGVWFIAYGEAANARTEAGFHFRDEHFVPGEYVSIREDDDQMHTFRVEEVRRP